MKYDIVYILKNDVQPDELRYSLRSVCKNFPYRKIWFYGGVPEGIEPDVMVEYAQTGANKWQRVSNTITEICQNEEITEDFWLFNDDFFVMKKLRGMDPMVAGTLEKRVENIAAKHYGRMSPYARQLSETAAVLRQNGLDTIDYALHVPMLINRKKALQTLKKFSGRPMFRSLYGNHHNIGGVLSKDVKIHDLEKEPTGCEKLLSTSNESFSKGKVGEYIRLQFPEQCKYEL